MEYFEVPVPEQDYGICSDNLCPCNETRIPKGDGYLYVTTENIKYRKDALSINDWQSKLQRLSHKSGAELLLGQGIGYPIFMCKQGAIKRNLNLDVAASDAKHWWATGKVPLRITPQIKASESSDVYDSEQNSDFENDFNAFIDDRDGQIYRTIKIGNQVWMAENLNFDVKPELVTKKKAKIIYENKPYKLMGLIPMTKKIKREVEVEVEEQVEYSWPVFSNEELNEKIKFGRHYKWEAAIKACPEGWHLPSTDEWNQLADYVNEIKHIEGGEKGSWFEVGKYLKSTVGWLRNTAKDIPGDGNDELKFTGYPAGLTNQSGQVLITKCAEWWTSTEKDELYAYRYLITYEADFLIRGGSEKSFGLSVRCLKNM